MANDPAIGALKLPVYAWCGLMIAGVEVTAPDYVRLPITLLLCSDGVTVANLSPLQWAHATTNWGTVDGIVIYRMQTGTGVSSSAILLTAPAPWPVDIMLYDIPRIPAVGIHAVQMWLPSTFGVRSYGIGRYGTYKALVGSSVLIERAFDQAGHVCAPSTWADGPFSLAA